MKFAFKIFLGIIPVAAVILVVVQVVLSTELAALGKTLGKLDTQISQERDVYADLSTQVASVSALSAIRERALSQGFTEPTNAQIIALTPEVPVALQVHGAGIIQ